MDQVAALPVVPPTQPFHLQPGVFQGLPGHLDLGLRAAVRERERQGVVDENFHARTHHTRHPPGRNPAAHAAACATAPDA